MTRESTGRAARPAPAATPLEQALAAWREVLGPEAVLTSEATLAHYARSTLALSRRASTVLRPASQQEVSAAVKVAGRFGIPLYPISRGKNWGYGDACPVTRDNAILDLSRMDRIIEVNRELAYAVIEPGVTQGQLTEHLRREKIPLWADCTGAGPDTSYLGNILDRGSGHTQYGDRARAISGLEVVLADGRVLKTGFGHYEGASTTHVFPYGIGPQLDGLFVQSGMGIVTQLGLWLMPEPEAFRLFLVSLDRPEAIGPFVEQLRRLRLNGTIKSVVHIGNDLRAISSARSFPRDLVPAGHGLPPALRARWRREMGVGAWNATGALSGTKRQVKAAARDLRQALARPGCRLHFFTEERLAWSDRLLQPFSRFAPVAGLRDKLAAVRAVYDMNRGRPSSRFMTGAYWRRRGGQPPDLDRADPAADNCGMLWLMPVMPMTGADVEAFLAFSEPIFAAHGFDFLVTFNAINERALGAVLSVMFDRDDPAEATAAQACYRRLLEASMAAGFPPYRVAPPAMGLLDQGSETFWHVVAAVKKALDPGALLAPGRYDPARARDEEGP